MSKSNILVGLVDDHPMMRAGLAVFIRSLRGYALVFEANSAEAALHHMRQAPVHLLITDILLPAMSGVDLARTVHHEFATTRVLMLSGFDTPAAIKSARDAGANGLVSKMSVTKDLADAITAVANGKEFWSASAKAQPEPDYGYGSDSASMLRPRSATLSVREKEVFRYIGKGLSSKNIAQTLGLSIRTIDVHRANIKRKLGTRTTSELLKYAVLANELDPPPPPVSLSKKK
jgi:two-component system, NarL family, nitrate/nitrite response regulator NarL